jgi:hypothetical protein
VEVEEGEGAIEEEEEEDTEVAEGIKQVAEVIREVGAEVVAARLGRRVLPAHQARPVRMEKTETTEKKVKKDRPDRKVLPATKETREKMDLPDRKVLQAKKVIQEVMDLLDPMENPVKTAKMDHLENQGRWARKEILDSLVK